MGVRLITTVLASILALATCGVAAEKVPGESKEVTLQKTANESVAGEAADKTTKATEGKTTAKGSVRKPAATQTVTERVPRGYGKLNLTQEQRNRVITIQRDYQERINQLLAEVDQLKMNRATDLQEVLDKPQRDLLREITTRVATTKTK